MPTAIHSRHRMTKAPAMTFAGLSRHYRMDQKEGFIAQWKAFMADRGMIADQAYDRSTTYGVCYNVDESGYDYLCAVEMQDDADSFETFQYVETLARDYAVFTHEGLIDTIDQTWRTLMDRWLPEAGLKMAHAPSFEKYLPGFDPRTPGHVEIWIPVQS